MSTPLFAVPLVKNYLMIFRTRIRAHYSCFYIHCVIAHYTSGRRFSLSIETLSMDFVNDNGFHELRLFLSILSQYDVRRPISNYRVSFPLVDISPYYYYFTLHSHYYRSISSILSIHV